MRNFVKLLEITEVIACAVGLLGIFFYFHGCSKQDDGFMVCHWAQNTVMAILALLVILTLLSLVMPAGRLKAGISIAMVPTALLMALIPGYVIDLCANKNVLCLTRLKPFTLVMALVIAGLALIHTLFAILSARPPKADKSNGEDIRMSSRRKNHPLPDAPAEDEWLFDDPEGIE